MSRLYVLNTNNMNAVCPYWAIYVFMMIIDLDNG